MNNYIKLIIALLFLSALNTESLAYNSLSGTTRGTFLKWNSGVRSSAMGNSFIGLADDVSAIYFNPAGLSQIDLIYLSSTYSNLFAGINFANGSIVIPMNKNTFGFSYNYVNFGGIDETTIVQPQGTGRAFTPMASEYIYSLAHRINNSLSLGGNLRIINEEIAGNASTGYGADLSALWIMSDVYSIGLNAKNITGSLGGEPIFKNYGIGLSRKFNNFLLNLDMNFPNDDNYGINMGAEYNFKDMVYLRMGATSKTASSSGSITDSKPTATYGIGINYKNSMFDYALITYGDLGPTHRFALSFPLSQKSEARLTMIEVFPKDIELEPGDVVTFEAKAYNSRGNIVHVPLSWKVDGKIGEINSVTGIFKATKIGEGIVIVKYNTIKGAANINVIK